MKLYTAFSIISVAIVLVSQGALAAKGQHKRQVQEPSDKNQPPPDENEPPRRRQRREPVRGVVQEPPAENQPPPDENQPPRQRQRREPIRGVPSRRRYVGLDPQPRPPPHINETGYYNLPETFWFSPNDRDARTLAEATHEAITQVFDSYPQNSLARTRMDEQLDRHQEAWMNGIRARYISEDSRQGRQDPRFDNWEDMQEYLIDMWREEYISQLQIFLAWYRDYLLRLLATWFDHLGVPRREDPDDDPSGLPIHPGPTSVPRNANSS